MIGMAWWLIRAGLVVGGIRAAWRWLDLGGGLASILAFVRSLDPKASGADLGLVIVVCFAACAFIGLAYFLIGNLIALQIASTRKQRGL